MASSAAAVIVFGLPLALLLASGFLATPSFGYQLTVEQVVNASRAIRAVVNSVEAEAPSGAGKYKLFVAGFIRLVFHACVGTKCVGCLNVNDPSNNGLNLSVSALEGVRSQLGFEIRRGDLWALAAKVAYEVGVQAAGGSALEVDAVRFLYGREDCPTAPYTEDMLEFPNMRWGVDTALQYFRDRGFTDRQIVALMGFHTLGVVRDGAKPIGQWVASPDVISNQFYVDLRGKQWSQRASYFNSSGSTVYTWHRGESPSMIMINTDVAFLRNFSLSNESTGESSCAVVSDCPRARTAEVVDEYAGDAVAWRRDASAALAQLTERGYGASLRLPMATPATACQSCSGNGAGAAAVTDATSLAVQLLSVATATIASIATSGR